MVSSDAELSCTSVQLGWAARSSSACTPSEHLITVLDHLERSVRLCCTLSTFRGLHCLFAVLGQLRLM